jgi:hypothetical protein
MNPGSRLLRPHRRRWLPLSWWSRPRPRHQWLLLSWWSHPRCAWRRWLGNLRECQTSSLQGIQRYVWSPLDDVRLGRGRLRTTQMPASLESERASTKRHDAARHSNYSRNRLTNVTFMSNHITCISRISFNSAELRVIINNFNHILNIGLVLNSYRKFNTSPFFI